MACYRVEAMAEAQALPRILEHFAVRDTLPSQVIAEADGEVLRLTIRHGGLEPGLAKLIAEKIRTGVSVHKVELFDEQPKDVQ